MTPSEVSAAAVGQHSQTRESTTDSFSGLPVQPDGVRSANFKEACVPSTSNQLSMARSPRTVICGSVVLAAAGEATGSGASVRFEFADGGCWACVTVRSARAANSEIADAFIG